MQVCLKQFLLIEIVGYGLNLNIRRIIFHKISKFDGIELRNLNSSEIKQISGRAGRFKSLYPHGEVSAFSMSDLKYIEKEYFRPSETILYAGIVPSLRKLENAFFELNHFSLTQVLEKFYDIAKIDKTYFICKMEG
jgi:ATP-dependent RNA helicase SUPV3L1/SUV3